MKSRAKDLKLDRLNRSVLRRLATVTTLSMFLTPVVKANVIGSDMQLFNPTTDGLDFITVESSETLLPGFMNFGLFMNYAVNSLPYFEDDGQQQTKGHFNDTLLAADINVGVGVAKNLSVGLSLPQVLTQTISKDGYNGRFRDNGNTEIRGNIKYRLFGDQDGGVAIGGVVNVNRTTDNPYVGDPARPIYTAQLIGDKKITNDLTLGVNIGYRWRNPGEAVKEAAPIKPLPNQIIESVAASYRIDAIDSKIIAELYGSQAAASVNKNGDRTAGSSEALLGIKHDVNTNLAIHGGFGTELQHGISTPDWRLYAGINWSIGPKFDEPQRVTHDSAPPAPAASPFSGPPKAYERVIVHDILFEFDSSDNMVGPSKDTLAQLAGYLNQTPVFSKLMVIGHTDSIGSASYNEKLSQKRADTIKRWLVTHHHLDGNKIFSEGHGAREPVSSNANFQGRQLNRRVEFRIYREKGKNPEVIDTSKKP